MIPATSFTDSLLSEAIAHYFQRGVGSDNRITGGADRRAITELAFTAVYGPDVRNWPSGWQAQWDSVENAIAGKHIVIRVEFKDAP